MPSDDMNNEITGDTKTNTMNKTNIMAQRGLTMDNMHTGWLERLGVTEKKLASVCAFIVCLCYEKIRKIKVNSAIPDWTLMWCYEFGFEISPGRLSLHASRCSWCSAVSFHLKYTILLSWFSVDFLRPTFFPLIVSASVVPAEIKCGMCCSTTNY